MRRFILVNLCNLFLFSCNPCWAQNITRAGNYEIYTWTASPRFAQRVLTIVDQYRNLPGLPSTAPAFGKPIRIYLAPDERTFRNLTSGRAPEWGAAVAAPQEGIIVVRAYGGTRGAYAELPRVLRHELAHIALTRYLAPAFVPRWFDEGYAEWSAGELDSEGAWLLRVAFATNRAPPLDSLELSWPALTTDARIAYLLAASVVDYMVRASGQRGLTIFLRRWHDSQNFDKALAGTYGVSLDQLENHWRKDVKRRYGWLAVITQTSIAFSMMAVGVLALYLVRRRRDRAKLAQLKATEPPDEPEFWNEPPPAEPPAD